MEVKLNSSNQILIFTKTCMQRFPCKCQWYYTTIENDTKTSVDYNTIQKYYNNRNLTVPIELQPCMSIKPIKIRPEMIQDFIMD